MQRQQTLQPKRVTLRYTILELKLEVENQFPPDAHCEFFGGVGQTKARALPSSYLLVFHTISYSFMRGDFFL